MAGKVSGWLDRLKDWAKGGGWGLVPGPAPAWGRA